MLAFENFTDCLDPNQVVMNKKLEIKSTNHTLALGLQLWLQNLTGPEIIAYSFGPVDICEKWSGSPVASVSLEIFPTRLGIQVSIGMD